MQSPIFPPAQVGSDGIARLEFPGARLDDLADGAGLLDSQLLTAKLVRF